MRIIPFLVLMFLTVNNYSAYIDTRDMSAESQRIQRLLGQIDGLQMAPRSSSGVSGGQIALLTMITSGVALSAIGSSYGYYTPYYDRPYYRPYRPRPYPRRYYRNRDSVAVGTGVALAAAGIIGLIASEAIAAENSYTSEAPSGTQKIFEIEKEINTIISNLVTTDQDYLQEYSQLKASLTRSTEQQVQAINDTVTNDITILKQQLIQQSNDFVDLTNTLISDMEKLEKENLKTIASNILIMDESSKSTVKELKRLNKTLEKQTAKAKKSLTSQLKKEQKRFQKEFAVSQEQQIEVIEKLKNYQNTEIQKVVGEADKQLTDLLQSYIKIYINRIAVK